MGEMTKTGPGTIRVWLSSESVTEGINSALSGYVKPEVFKSQMLISLSQPDCVKCTPKSQFEVVHQCAQLALLPSLGQVALIPRRNRDTNNYELTAMVQWQGYQALMHRVPGVRDIKARLVHVKDTYSFDSLTETLQHDYDPFDDSRQFKGMDDLRGGYMVIKFDDGREDKWHYVSKQVFEKARKCAQTLDIWNAWFYEQCMKTVFRNAFARRVINIDPFVGKQIQEAADQDDAVMGNDPARVIETTASPVESAPVSRSQQMAQSMRDSARSEIDAMMTATPDPVDDEPVAETTEKKPTRTRKSTKGKAKPKDLIPDEPEDSDSDEGDSEADGALESILEKEKPTYDDCVKAIELMTLETGQAVQELCRKAAKNPEQYQDLMSHLTDKERDLSADDNL